MRKSLKRSLQTDKSYERIRQGSYRAVLDGQFCGRTEFCELIDRIDELLTAGRPLKESSMSTSVAHLTWNGKDVVVKRYDYRGVFRAVRQTIKNMNSYARRSWLYAHRLRMLGVPGPEPVAYIEKYSGPIVLKSYFISKSLQGRSLNTYLEDETVGRGKYPTVAEKVLHLLREMGKYRISHGDMKFGNILLTADKAVILDLDRMRVHKLSWEYRFWRSRDLKRFARDLRGYPAFEAVARGLVMQNELSSLAGLFSDR